MSASMEQVLAAKFRERGIGNAVIHTGSQTITISLAEACQPITNGCKVNQTCCLADGHDSNCDTSIHENFTNILSHIAFKLGLTSQSWDATMEPK